MQILIKDDDGKVMTEIAVGPEAKRLVNLAFNPSGSARNTTLKALAAGLIECMADKLASGKGVEEAKAAIGHVRTAQMWCVLAETREE